VQVNPGYPKWICPRVRYASSRKKLRLPMNVLPGYG
jgi:hypothetical protein